uniref:Isochorismatase-like domain-containing protein n=1 Tax=Fibrocapsa japonica TaxID=94617 RepID=A0A7S2UVL2_9STRA|mmetsp:Transcript_1561/g.2143  ORF Transcript_1561/g.2143 Transcript_1561/m.2143 type:complete len:274 (+) Transcript_1561:118-939(+)|eukprot:CAMPEP_0113941564 /NCGR_PEP_ID=MMETSP1339-20121228/7455_1 /TAXON_ID=94617 /ORGANISM="Fibrocapsa japonica" /LENGTH=273 /DNA_ID=CAMNT_0000945745 /DNA_START=119 /DNA_END=940 /DNA_ORIENTATION=- /assembly_acc=CAM_ASM_000762
MSGKPRNVAFLIIDPQNDFHEGGSLAVPGADEDAVRIANLINDNRDKIASIYVTMDCHHRMHIAHKGFWTNDQNEMPAEFTMITNADIKSGLWKAAQPENQMHVEWYTKMLEEKNRFKLTIWPEHCLVGTKGNAIVPSINEAIQDWALEYSTVVNYIQKTQHCLTEMYSVFQAEVPLPDVPSTGLNTALLAELGQTYDRVVVCGQASSHCVAFSVRDLVEHWPHYSGDRPISDIILLSDGMSPVATFEKAGEEFVNEMKDKGVTVLKCNQVIL